MLPATTAPPVHSYRLQSLYPTLREAATRPYGPTETAPTPAAATATRPHDQAEAPTLASALDPDEEVFLLGERCAQAYMEADVLQYRAMTLLAEFHHREGWQDTGFGSTAEWLAWRIGIRIGSARERLRTALALTQLPLTSKAMEAGHLSFTKVRALTRAATPDNEAVLLELAQAGSAANLERVVRGWKLLDRSSEITAEELRHRRRRLRAYVADDGMVVVRGRLDPETGAMLLRALEAAEDGLFREEGEPATSIDPLGQVTREQRRADALGLVAERALAAGFGAGRLTSGSKAERYQVLLHVDETTLKESGEAGLSELEDGTRVSAETSRRVACDGSVVTVGRRKGGGVVGAGRRRRTVSPALRRALEARDRGCRFPGCGSRFTEAHHVEHWADGGETTLGNLVLLCGRHHRAVHEGGTKACLDRDGQVVFFTPRGQVLAGSHPTCVPLREGDGEMGGRRRSGGERDGGRGRRGNRDEVLLPPAPHHKKDRDIPWELEARVWDTLDPA